MVESLVVYCALFVVMLLCCVGEKKTVSRYEETNGFYQENKRFLSGNILILSLSFAFVFGCRWGVGRDYFRYLDSFLYRTPERFEFLFYLITEFFKKNGLHFSFYFGFLALLDIILLFYAAKDYKFIFPYIAFFLIFGYHFLTMMNAIRQSISALIFLVSIKYIDGKNFKVFLLCVVVAALFHKLSVLLFIFYPLLRVRDDWFRGIQYQLILYVAAIVISYNYDVMMKWIETPFEFLTNVLDYDNYQYDTLMSDRFDRNNLGSKGLGIYANILRTVPVIVLSKEMKKFYNSSRFNMMYSLYFLGVLMSLILGRSIILNRFNYFCVFFTILIYAFFCYYCFQKRQIGYQIAALSMIVIHIPLFINIIANTNNLSQYSFFWESKMFL